MAKLKKPKAKLKKLSPEKEDVFIRKMVGQANYRRFYTYVSDAYGFKRAKIDKQWRKAKQAVQDEKAQAAHDKEMREHDRNLRALSKGDARRRAEAHKRKQKEARIG
jgi:hypothetical protein